MFYCTHSSGLANARDVSKVIDYDHWCHSMQTDAVSIAQCYSVCLACVMIGGGVIPSLGWGSHYILDNLEAKEIRCTYEMSQSSMYLWLKSELLHTDTYCPGFYKMQVTPWTLHSNTVLHSSSTLGSTVHDCKVGGPSYFKSLETVYTSWPSFSKRFPSLQYYRLCRKIRGTFTGQSTEDEILRNTWILQNNEVFWTN